MEALMSTALDSAKYVSLTTFRSDGSPVRTPMWIMGVGGRYQVMTPADSWKVKRIAANPRVTLAVSNARGRVAEGTQEEPATAVILTGAASDEVVEQIVAKYGLAAKLIGLVSRLRGRDLGRYVGIELTVDGS